MNINITTCNLSSMRYPTVGDWFPVRDIVAGNDYLQIRAVDMEKESYSFLVALHELIEAWLCAKRAIPASIIDMWDKNSKADEPGDEEDAPYHKEHVFATRIERMVADELGVNWDEYEKHLGEVLKA